MDIVEDLNHDDMTVYRMTPTSILSSENAAARSTSSVASSGGGGAGGGSAELGRRLLLAAKHGDTQLVLDLMAKGAPFTTDWLGTSALHFAALGAHTATCAVLLRAGVSRDARSKVERTPLHLAAYAGHAPVAALLLQHRARPDPRDMLQMSPLHWAAQRGHAEVVALLLQHGADPLALSKFKKTPRELAAARRHAHVLRLLDAALREREAAQSVEALREREAAQSVEALREREAAQSVEALREHEASQSVEALQRAAAEAEPGDSQPMLDPIEQSHEVAKQPTKRSGTPGPAGAAGAAKLGADTPAEARAGAAAAAAAAAMLRRHGIALLPRDEGSTVLSALQSGRSVVLSDAGKLMLKESGDIPQVGVKRGRSPPAPGAAGPAPAAPATAPATSKGVVLTATPVKSTPRQGVKIFTLNNKLLAMPKENKAPIKKIINPHDSMQIQYIKLPSDAKITSRTIAMKAKSKVSGVSPPGGPAPRPPRSPVKLTLSRGSFSKLRVDGALEAAAGEGAGAAGRELRAQLVAAHRTIALLSAQLDSYKSRLANYEDV